MRCRLFALAIFANLMACAGSDSTDPPKVDAVSATVGAAGGTVVTPSGAAGVQIPPGVLSQDVVVTVTQLPAPSARGVGPLPTSLKQYGPYYEFSTSPATVQFGDSVRVGVCQVTDRNDPLYAPESAHDRLRLAHTVGAGIEILERADVYDFLRCSNVTARKSRTGWRDNLAIMLERVTRPLQPEALYAAHGGLGGKVKSFSPFGAVDPGVTIVASPLRGLRDVTVIDFVASGGSSNSTYEWDFGDGTSGIGATVSHIFKQAGTLSVKVHASSAAGNFSVSRLITIGSMDGFWRYAPTCCVFRLFIIQRGDQLEGQWVTTFPPGSAFGGPTDTAASALSGAITGPSSLIIKQLGDCQRTINATLSEDMMSFQGAEVFGNPNCTNPGSVKFVKEQ